MSEELSSKKINQSNNYENPLHNREIKIKNNWKSLIYSLPKSIINILVFCLVTIAFSKNKAWYLIGIVILLDLVFMIIEWNKTFLVISNDEAKYHKGILSKKTLIIPRKNLKSMDISQNLIEKILGYKVLKIESSAKNAGLEEIKFMFSDKEIEILKNFAFSGDNEIYDEKLEIAEASLVLNKKEPIENSTCNDTTSEKQYERKFENKKLILFGFTSFNLFVALIFIFNGIDYLEKIVTVNFLDSFFSRVEQYTLSVGIIVVGFISLVGILLGLKLIATIYYFIKYYNFTISKSGENIKIKYGLLSTKEFSFKEDNIKMIKIKSNPIRQLIKKYQVNLTLKGYSGEGKDRVLLYPLGDLEEVQNLIEELIPQWKVEGDGEGIKHGRITMIIKPVLVILFTSVIALLIFKTPWVMLINLLLLIVIPSTILKGKNTDLKVKDNKVRVVTGGFFRTIHILKARDIQAVSFKDNPIQSNLGVGKIIIDYYSEIVEEVKLPYMKKEFVNEILNESYKKSLKVN